jgi:hypothetical protein
MALSPVANVDPLPIDASVPPPSEKITIQVAAVNGSGCPIGTAAVAPSQDNTAFTITYSNYLAQVGGGAKATDFRKNCQISLVINVPSGFTYAIASADYRGFASLERGATGLEKANYYFMGTSANTAITHRLNGPFNDDWQFTDQTDSINMVYAPFGVQRNLNINTELRVSAGTSDINTSTSFMTMDSIDGAYSTKYHFSWKQC